MACFTLSKGMTTVLTRAENAGEKITFDSGATYDARYCARYALLYQNAYGGWDSFLIEGNVYKSTKYTQNTYAKAYDNTTLDRETRNYANELTDTWTCTTGWLSDEESLRLAEHLLPSPDVFLQDIEEGKLIPVTMSTTSFKHKTYGNEGHRMVNYQFTLTEANSKVRQD